MPLGGVASFNGLKSTVQLSEQSNSANKTEEKPVT